MSTEIISPNNVLANAMLRTVDMIRPRLQATSPDRVACCVGTQINGAPHLGTSLVQTAAFLLARAAKRTFNVDAVVRFGALDNAPYDIRLDPETHHAYQQTYYRAMFDSLADATGFDYEVETYSALQATPAFRHEFLAPLGHLDQIRWPLAPSHGQVHLRLPCPDCGWAEKRAERTRLLRAGPGGADFAAVCTDHGDYKACVTPDTSAYLDLATLYRNLVKERLAARDHVTLSVMVKGGDWAYGCQLVDEAFTQLPGLSPPPRVFTPMVLTDTGAKLSKSLIREGKVPPPPGAQPWMLDATEWAADTDAYVDAMVWLVNQMLADPRHFYRSYTTAEIDRIMTALPAAAPGVRAREMNLYRRYFDLVANGTFATSRPATTSGSSAAATKHSPRSPVSPATPRSSSCSTPKARRKSTRPRRATSSSPTSAASMAPRKRPSASWPSRSSSSPAPPPDSKGRPRRARIHGAPAALGVGRDTVCLVPAT
jgi:hypothetical protein